MPLSKLKKIEKVQYRPVASIGIVLEDLDATEHLAQLLADITKNKDVICLKGDLGVGKTTFSKSFINNFFDTPREVLSPTFSVINPFETKHFTLYHCDLYRINNIEEIGELGLEDIFNNGAAIIEWPEIIEHILPDNHLSIELQFDASYSQKRVATLNGYGTWEKNVELLKHSCPLTQFAIS